jgi:hypothetical protein
MHAMLALRNDKLLLKKFWPKFWINWYVVLELLYIIGKDIQHSLISYSKYSSLQVEQIPLPLLFMRTVLQAIGAFPTLVWSLLIHGNLINAKKHFLLFVVQNSLKSHKDPSELLCLSFTIEFFPIKNPPSFLVICFYCMIKVYIFVQIIDLDKFL